MSKMRIVVLDLFKRLYADNDIEYDVTLKSTFQNRMPSDFKNVPTFSNIDSLDQIIENSVLNKEGIIVGFDYNSGYEKNSLDFKIKFP